MNEDIQVIKQDHHRNGVGGAGFVVSLFQWRVDSEDQEAEPRMFVGVSFDDAETIAEFVDHTAVLDVGLLVDGAIEFTVNSWRGADHCGPTLAQAWIERCQAQDPPYLPFR